MRLIEGITRDGFFWLRENLFKSFFNSFMTLLSVVLVGYLFYGFLGFWGNRSLRSVGP